MIKNTQQITNKIQTQLLLLNRCDLQFYYKNSENLNLTPKFIDFIDQSLKGNLQPKFDQQLEEFADFCSKEVKERISYATDVLQQINEMQAKQDSIVDLWSPELIQQSNQFISSSKDAEDYVKDQEHEILRQMYEGFAKSYQEQILAAIYGLYDIKTTIQASFNPELNIQHTNIKEQLQPTTAQLQSLVNEIQQARAFDEQFQPIKQLLQAYKINLQKSKELKLLQQDKTRITGKDRAAVQKRRRETQLQSELLKEFPLILSKLKISLQQLESKNKSEIQKILDSIVSQQDRRFQQKYETLVKRLQNEAERKIKQNNIIQSSAVERSCFIIKSVVESQIQ